MPVPEHAPDSLMQRYAHNPLLRGADWPYPINAVFNAGGALLPDGDTLLLCRVEGRCGISHLSAARSADGLGGWTIDPQPTLSADVEKHPEEAWGLEDSRITFLSELDRYAVTYTSYSFRGPGVSLALTSDFKTFERYGQVLPIENKDAALLPRRIDGRWAMIHRPVPYSVGGAHIWISFSPDLKHWGDHHLVLATREQPYWDGHKIGLGPPPIETPEGWLIVYHAARSTVSGTNYYNGLALLDLENPTRCVRRGRTWIFGPQTDYERTGDVDNVVFPCGYTQPGGDEVRFYYGAADTCIALATAKLSALLEWLHEE